MGDIVKNLKTYKPPAGDSQWHKFAEGTTTIRILSHSYHYVSHYIRSEKKSYNCTGDISTCQWCQQGDQSRNRWGYLILIRGDVPAVKPVEFGWSIFETVLELGKDKDFGDPRNYDLKITRKGTDKETRYTVIPGRDIKLTDKENLVVGPFDDVDKATEKLLSFYKKDDRPNGEEEGKEILDEPEE